MVSFYISGSLHLSADLVLGVPLWESGSLKFFTTQALAIVVQEVSIRASGGDRNSLWRRRMGFIWVIAFMYWSSPAWSYPAAHVVRPQKDVILPFSIIGKVM
jgi:hypothetical protein